MDIRQLSASKTA